MHRVCLFSPSRFSLYTTTVAELLIREGVRIDTVFVTSLVNPARLRAEFRRDGRRLATKIWRKLVLRERAYRPKPFETLRDLRASKGITARTVEQFAKAHGASIIYCKTLNDEVVIEGLRRSKPDLVVFTGGGLIRGPTLAVAGAGVVNCHMGSLPAYRGMDVVEWPLLERRFEALGFTVHFMDQGVDTGDILRVHPVEIRAGESISEIRERFEPLMCRGIVLDTVDFLAGRVQRRTQCAGDGKQYFIMHPRLTALAERHLTRRAQP